MTGSRGEARPARDRPRPSHLPLSAHHLSPVVREARPLAVDLWDAVASLAATVLGLSVAIALLDPISVTSLWSIPLAALVVSLVTWVVAAPLRMVADRLGGIVAFVLGLAAQITAMWAALRWLPGLVVTSWWAAALALLITALVVAATSWVAGGSDAGYVVGDVLWRGRRRAAQRRRADRAGTPLPDDREPGLLLVILDGVAEPVLRTAVEAGMVPTISRWLTDGSYRLESWWAQVPSTTPASTAGLLHGAADRIPAFRWWDEAQARLVVANHPRDAAAIESAMSDGEGLLAHGGAAIGTMFSGDAPATRLVMSRPVGARGRRDGGVYVRFFLQPLVFARTLVLTIGEMVKELYQARLARLRGVEPRISRGGWYVVLRAMSNVTLRGLNTALVAEHMERGTPTIAVDYVDYDEIAHHAGPLRAESLRSLEGLDAVLRALETVNEVARRRYRIVCVSDHGQALGPTFEQVAGVSLEHLVTTLMGKDPRSALASGGGEEWGPVNALLNELVRPIRSPRSPRAARGSGSRGSRGSGGSGGSRAADDARTAGVTVTGPEREQVGLAPGTAAEDSVAVIASGNLGLVWFTGRPGRLTLAQTQEAWPDLVAGLATHPAIAVVVVDSAQGLLAVGPAGLRLLEPERAAGRSADPASGGDPGRALVEGEDPLATFEDPDAAARDLARAGRLPHTGDLLLVSTVRDGRVCAFEHQVGSHGGLGGDQNHALLLHPTSLTRPDDAEPLVGANAVFHQLVAWQRELGLRP